MILLDFVLTIMQSLLNFRANWLNLYQNSIDLSPKHINVLFFSIDQLFEISFEDKFLLWMSKDLSEILLKLIALKQKIIKTKKLL